MRAEPEPRDARADPPADPVDVARSICLAQLTRGPRTRAQLAETLRKRLVPEHAATTVLDRLTEVGLVDDAAFATAWVQSRRSTRGLSGRALARELRDRGVAPNLVEHAVADIDAEDEEATMRDLVRRRLRTMAGVPADAQTRRLVGYLGRKGYEPGLSFRVVRAELEQVDPLG